MHKRELVAKMVVAAKSALEHLGYEETKTVSVKIRIHKDLRSELPLLGPVAFTRC